MEGMPHLRRRVKTVEVEELVDVLYIRKTS